MKPSLDQLPSTPSRTEGWPWTAEHETHPTTKGSCEEPPRISIVVPSYQQGDFLEEALRSIILQGYCNLELIVIDGGSSDRSIDILRKYDPWISYWVSEVDSGQSSAINKGLLKCTGQIVTFFGTDDVYRPGAFEKVVSLWREQTTSGAIVGAFRFINEESQPESQVIPPRLPHPGPWDLALLPVEKWRLHQVSCFYSAKALDQIGRFVRKDLHYTMDRELLYRICRRFPIAITDLHFADFRRHSRSKSGSQILPFSREMAALQFIDAPATEAGLARQARHRIARYRLARGQLKLARAVKRRTARAMALLRALRYQPSLALNRGFLAQVSQMFGICTVLRILSSKSQDGKGAAQRHS